MHRHAVLMIGVILTLTYRIELVDVVFRVDTQEKAVNRVAAVHGETGVDIQTGSEQVDRMTILGPYIRRLFAFAYVHGVCREQERVPHLKVQTCYRVAFAAGCRIGHHVRKDTGLGIDGIVPYIRLTAAYRVIDIALVCRLRTTYCHVF